jgi:hypothetical protein
MRFLTGVSVFVTGLLLLSGCGAGNNPFGGSQSNIQPGHDPGIPGTLAAASGNEFVSSSLQMKATANNRFLVQGTLTSTTNQIKQKTTPRNYILFSNVQGQIISSEAGF